MKKHSNFIICLFFFLFISILFPHDVPAQADLSTPYLKSLMKHQLSTPEDRSSGRLIFFRVWDDLAYLASEPDFYGVVGGLALSPGVLPSAFKNESPELTELWGSSAFADNLFETGEIVGDGAFPFIVSATSWGVGKITGWSKLRDFGTDLFRAQAINGLLTAVLKGSINRTRPNGAPYSYPSGHTSSSFATAGIIYAHFGKTWGIPAFILAGYVGLSRLQEGKHYLSDVIAGGILGTYVSLKLAHRDRNRGSMSIIPIKAGKSLGLSLSIKF